MTTTAATKKPFQSISADIDVEIERVARAKGVPRLSAELSPSAATSSLREGEEGQPRPAAADAGRSDGPTPRARIFYVKAGLPDYALTELKTRALQQRVSVNHLILMALKAAGIPIEDADLIEDGRRLRGGRTAW